MWLLYQDYFLSFQFASIDFPQFHTICQSPLKPQLIVSFVSKVCLSSLSLSYDNFHLFLELWSKRQVLHYSHQCLYNSHLGLKSQVHFRVRVGRLSLSRLRLFPIFSEKCRFSLWRCRLLCIWGISLRLLWEFWGLKCSHLFFCMLLREL